MILSPQKEPKSRLKRTQKSTEAEYYSTLLAAVLPFYYVQTPTAALHQQPSVDSEVVSQAIFAEEVNILDEKEEWIKIETAEDHCTGWVLRDILCGRESTYADCSCVVPLVEVTRLSAHVYALRDKNYSPILTLPFESRLETLDLFEDPSSTWITVKFPNEMQAYIQRADVAAEIPALRLDDLAAFSKCFLNLPFTPGGRSSFGYDAPGFVQMLYRQLGLSIPRYLNDQYQWDGFETVSLENLASGDLLFWGLSQSEIQHVGLYIGENQFVHSSAKENQPWLRISSLDTPLYKGEEEWPFCIGKRLR